MGFLDNIVGSVANNVAGSIARGAQTAASRAANDALSAKSLAGLDAKGIVAKTRFIKMQNFVEVYFDNRKLGNIDQPTINSLNGKPPEIQHIVIQDYVGRLKEEFKNKEVAKRLAEKFFQEIKV